jgi:hypothetical protein
MVDCFSASTLTALANANAVSNHVAASDSCDLDSVVRLTAGSAQIAV